LNRVNDPNYSAEIKRTSFESALEGIRTGEMTFSKDALLPMVQEELASRVGRF
jgi:hypothetical protein